MKSETIKPFADVQSLVTNLFTDAKRFITSSYWDKDVEYVLSRLAAEGVPFLFSTLPLLGKAVETSLIREERLIVPCAFRCVSSTGLPKFMHHVFKMVYEDKGDLLPLDEIDVKAVEIIRQITLFFAKVEVMNEDLTKEALSAFSSRVVKCGLVKHHFVHKLARRFIARVFSDCSDPTVLRFNEFFNEPWGRHGPGAVAGGEKGGEKWCFNEFPGIPQRLYAINDGMVIAVQEEHAVQASRVVAVPKDFRGPRIICAEPKECQFAQQGLKDLLYELLNTHYLTRRHINFNDVSRNRAACFKTELATIDLKDASDNLSLELAKLLLPKHVFRLLTRYRSRGVNIDGQVIRPKTFATMGSALCFPIQTLIFLSICKGCQWFVNRVKTVEKSPILVYGDDIIVSRSIAPLVIEVLEASGLVINTQKTALRTLVKESCGEWVIRGVSQVIVKPKTIRVVDTSTWVSVRETALELCDAGWFATANHLADLVHDFYPSVKRKYNRGLQRLEYRVPVLVDTESVSSAVRARRRATTDTESQLYAYFVKTNTTPPLHGARVRAKRRWVSWHPYSHDILW